MSFTLHIRRNYSKEGLTDLQTSPGPTPQLPQTLLSTTQPGLGAGDWGFLFNGYKVWEDEKCSVDGGDSDGIVLNMTEL